MSLSNMWNQIQIRQHKRVHAWNVSSCNLHFKMLSCQNTYFFQGQGTIKENQLINLHTSVVIIMVWVVFSNNNPAITSWIWLHFLGYVPDHFCSIVEYSDSFTGIASDVVQHNMSPIRWFAVVAYIEPSI